MPGKDGQPAEPVRPDRRAAGADRRAGPGSLGCGLQGLGRGGHAQVLRTGTGDRPVSARTWGSKPVAPPPSPSIEQPFRLQGQQFDEETGLHYNRFRQHDLSPV